MENGISTYPIPAFEALVPELSIEWAKAWRPDEEYFTRLSKAKILEMMQPILGKDWVKTHQDSKKAGLVKVVSDIITGKAKSLTKEQQAAAANWSPPGFAPVLKSVPKLTPPAAKKPVAKSAKPKTS